MYSKWWNEKLVPNLPKKCVVVLDGAGYHSVRRTDFIWPDKITPSKANKTILKNFLIHEGLPFPPKATKEELYELVKAFMETDAEYVLGRSLLPTQRLLFLPPYHSDELNPIEEIWGFFKNKVSHENQVKFDKKKVENLVVEALDATNDVNENGENRWASACRHIESNIAEYWREIQENLLEAGMIDEEIFEEDGEGAEGSDEDRMELSA